MVPFSRVRLVDGYLPIEDHGLLGDGNTAALVGRDGAISWMCVPRFDSPPLFCRILDARRGGAFTVAPEDLLESRQYYERDSGVLVTEMRGSTGTVRVADALTLRSSADLSDGTVAARSELVRSVRLLRGRARIRIEMDPHGGADAERRGDGFRIRCAGHPALDLQLFSSRPMGGLRDRIDLEAGDRLDLMLRWGPGSLRRVPADLRDLLEATLCCWRQWIKRLRYDGPQQALVRRSAITLKMLDFMENGAVIAAPTSSLPEAIGGPRNWDYRYAWIRDAAFSVYALRRIGLTWEAWAFLDWVLDAVERGGEPAVLYDLDGERPPPEREDPDLAGYRGSTPVRWGNGAADQVQNDAYGEIIDCAYQWARGGEEIEPALWRRLRALVDAAGEKWHQPDHGIWEVRTKPRTFTYTAALCQVALDRGARLARQLGHHGDAERWRTKAEEIRQAVLDEAWDPEANSLTEHLGGGGLDASLLSLPLRRVIPADHPRMIATTAAISQRLSAGNGLLYRYLPDASPDGLAGHEGAFLLCSFWLVDNLAKQGRLDEAMTLFDSLCSRANAVGLLPEQIDPGSGEFLGNFPQGFSHIGLISSGVNLARLTARSGNR